MRQDSKKKDSQGQNGIQLKSGFYEEPHLIRDFLKLYLSSSPANITLHYTNDSINDSTSFQNFKVTLGLRTIKPT